MTQTEQRQFERYYPPAGAIATFRPFAQVGAINDISKGGVAFEYTTFSRDHNAEIELESSREIAIFIPGSDSQLLTLPCKVVRVENRLLGSYARRIIPKKRCGVQFGKFGQKTEAELDAFLAQCEKCGHLES